MNTLRQNLTITVFAAAFSVCGLIGGVTGAQTKTAARPTPKTTPKPTSKITKATPKPTPKTAAKPTATPKPKTKTPAAKPTPAKSPATKPVTAKSPAVKPKTSPTPTKPTAPKQKENVQIIVSSASSRVRREPKTSAETIQTAKLGTIFTVAEQNAGWYKINPAKDGAENPGWISKTVTQLLTNSKRGETYQKIADKYLKQPNDFSTNVQLYNFLDSATGEVKTPKIAADLDLKKLLALQSALRKIPVDKKDQNPYAEFLKANEKTVVYSEPSGAFLVVSSQFWELHEKYKALPIGEEIAWKAAQNPLPGECEGYINCYLYLIRSTDGEYLNYYPNGKYSRQALKNVTSLLDPIAADTNEKAVYIAASDISDRADFNRYLTEIRAIISKTSYIEKSKTLAEINQIGDAHR